MKTIRLFDQNSHTYTFDATVISCETGGSPDTLTVILDATAFSPREAASTPIPVPSEAAP